MPLYEYECTECHRHTEKIQKFSDPEITTCPHCGGALKRVITAPAFSLKGGGWYADGYGSAKPSVPAGEGSNAGEGSKESVAKESGSKEGGGKESGAKPASGDATAAAPAPSAAPPASTPAPTAASNKS